MRTAQRLNEPENHRKKKKRSRQGKDDSKTPVFLQLGVHGCALLGKYGFCFQSAAEKNEIDTIKR